MGDSYMQGFGDGFDQGFDQAMRGNAPVFITEMALYGINLTLSIVTTVMLLRRGIEEGMAHKRLLLMIVLMFTIATAYITLNTLELNIYTPDWKSLTVPLRISEARQFLLLIQAALGDSVTIWRCYMIYRKNVLVVMLPVLTALASFGLYYAGVGSHAANLGSVHGVYSELAFAWSDNVYQWAAITMVCTIYCTVAITYRIYSSARLSKSNSLFAVMSFVVETSLIYTLGIVIYLLSRLGAIPSAPVADVQTILMGAVVQLPPIVLCLLTLQTKFYNQGRRAVHYSNPETARPLASLRRIFKTRRESPANAQISTFRAASAVTQESTHATSMPAEARHLDSRDASNTEHSDTIGHWDEDSRTETLVWHAASDSCKHARETPDALHTPMNVTTMPSGRMIAASIILNTGYACPPSSCSAGSTSSPVQFLAKHIEDLPHVARIRETSSVMAALPHHRRISTRVSGASSRVVPRRVRRCSSPSIHSKNDPTGFLVILAAGAMSDRPRQPSRGASPMHQASEGCAGKAISAFRQSFQISSSEMALYGMNLTLSIVATTVLRRRGAAEGTAHKRLFLVLMLMLTIGTTYITLNIVETFATSSTLRMRYYDALRSLLLVQVAMGDSVTIWRCYVVYERSILVVVLPALAALASFGLYLVSSEVAIPDHFKYNRHFAESMAAWDDASWKWAAPTVACTAYCATAISYRILASPRLAKGSNLSTAISFVIETGFLHMLGVIAYLLTIIFIKSPHAPIDVRFPLMGVIVQLPPIALCLLILRTKCCDNKSQSVRYTEPEPSPSLPSSAMRRTGRIRGEADSANGETQPSRTASATVHDLTHTMSPRARSLYIHGMPHTDDMDTNNQRKKDTSTALDIA
ncbi:hypothetical protein EVG20_g7598 [Dentipellis fragilis]|uniref:Uncharacterized protein n=1 Tax=Dentipellis fragilis TaxID=205917 RepID=A0A4Y9YDK8_9AGAM|nr:hypothetical protein EVG20_g7598 [Dentipellis fragilis]